VGIDTRCNPSHSIRLGVTRRSNATGTRERHGATGTAGTMSNGDMFWAGVEALSEMGVPSSGPRLGGRHAPERRAALLRGAATRRGACWSGWSWERLARGRSPVSHGQSPPILTGETSACVAVTQRGRRGATASSSPASSGIVMDACDAQGFGVQLGTRRKTALPGRHGASSLDQGTVRSALYPKVETVGRWIFKVCGTRRNADL
jgi:hypothetical protein